MIPKKLRLEVKDFPRRSGNIFTSPLFTVKTTKNNLTHNRFAVVIAAAAEKRAVYRNQMRRRILGAVREWPSLHTDFLFIASKRGCAAPAPELRAELKKVFTWAAQY